MINELSNLLTGLLTKQIDRNCGKGFFKIVKNWSQIVGEDLAKMSQPQHIGFSSGRSSGVLYIKVQSGSIGLNIFYNKEKIINEIAIFFGYRAIKELKTIIK